MQYQRKEKWRNNQKILFGKTLDINDLRLPNKDWDNTPQGREWIDQFEDLVAELIAMTAITRNTGSLFCSSIEVIKHICDMNHTDFLDMTLSYTDITNKLREINRELTELKQDGFLMKVCELCDNMLTLIETAKLLHKGKGLCGN